MCIRGALDLQPNLARLALGLLLVLACEQGSEPVSEAPAPSAEPTFLSLSERFSSARIENALPPRAVTARSQWTFKDGGDRE